MYDKLLVKEFIMKVKRLLYVLIIVPVMLLVICAFLTKRTLDYKWVNRELILQNDSLKGAVIELNKKINESYLHNENTSAKKK